MACACQDGRRGRATAMLHRVEWPADPVRGETATRVRRYVSKAEAVAAMSLRPGGTYYAPATD